MSGSWEILNHRSVLTAILHTETTSIAWAFGLRKLQLPGPIVGLCGMPYAMARNMACMRALECGADFLFFLDSDCIPIPDAVPRLLAHDLPLVSGLYCRRSPPHGVPVMIRNGTWVTDFRPGSMVEVDYVGAGCLLLRRDLLQQMPPQRPEAGQHWFDWKVDQASLLPPGEALSEDFSFCLHAKRTLGIKTIVDTSVVCRHAGMCQATFGRLDPLEAIA